MGLGLARKQSHGDMIRDVWPDKSLFGAVMLFMTGLLGILFAGFQAAIDVELSAKMPQVLRDYPPMITLLLSLLTFVLAGVSLRNRDTLWALWGCATGIIAFGLLGVGTILSVVALVFLMLSRVEREDYKPETLRLTSDQWPDKSLAASLLVLMAGVVAVIWGTLLVANLVTLELGQTLILGEASVVAGLVCFFASLQLYFQRTVWVGVLAALGAIGTIGFYAIGPLLGMAVLVLLFLAHREREFDKRHPTTASTSSSAGKPSP